METNILLKVVAWILSMNELTLGKPMGYEYPVPKVPFIEGSTVSTTIQDKPSTVSQNPDCVPQDMAGNQYYQNLIDIGVPFCSEEYDTYDQYDPSDVPDDQAAPEEKKEGYNYPIPENPLTLPTKRPIIPIVTEPLFTTPVITTTSTVSPPTLPDCISLEDELSGNKSEYILQGIPLCPDDYDEYDPSDIPPDQAAPKKEEQNGYNYPVPENPLTLPTKKHSTQIPITSTFTAPDTSVSTTTSPISPGCVREEEANLEINKIFISQGVPLCPLSGYNYSEPDNSVTLPPTVQLATKTIPTVTTTPQTTPYVSSSVPTFPPSELSNYRPELPEEYFEELLDELDELLDEYDPIEVPVDQSDPLPDCIPADKQADGENYKYLDAGVPLCSEEDKEGYNYPIPKNPLTPPPKVQTTPPTTTNKIPLPDCVIPGEVGSEVNIQFLNLGVPTCPEEYDEYDPSDIPDDQAEPLPDCIPADKQADGQNSNYLDAGVPLCPEEEKDGYNYPIPENPLTLPSKVQTTPTTTTTKVPLPDCVIQGEVGLEQNIQFLNLGVPICPEEYDEYDPSDIPDDQAEPLPDCIQADKKADGQNLNYLDAGVPLCPEEEKDGYNYPIPENPLTLPSKVQTTPATTTNKVPLPDCVIQGEVGLEQNIQFLDLGVPICTEEYDEYDPSDIPPDQAEDKKEGYSYPVPNNPLLLPKRKPKQLPLDSVLRTNDIDLTIGKLKELKKVKENQMKKIIKSKLKHKRLDRGKFNTSGGKDSKIKRMKGNEERSRNSRKQESEIKRKKQKEGKNNDGQRLSSSNSKREEDNQDLKEKMEITDNKHKSKEKSTPDSLHNSPRQGKSKRLHRKIPRGHGKISVKAWIARG